MFFNPKVVEMSFYGYFHLAYRTMFLINSQDEHVGRVMIENGKKTKKAETTKKMIFGKY